VAVLIERETGMSRLNKFLEQVRKVYMKNSASPSKASTEVENLIRKEFPRNNEDRPIPKEVYQATLVKLEMINSEEIGHVHSHNYDAVCFFIGRRCQDCPLKPNFGDLCMELVSNRISAFEAIKVVKEKMSKSKRAFGCPHKRSN
jgi:hypothetical protein